MDDLVKWLRAQLDEDEREILRHGPPIMNTPWVPASRLTTMQAGATVLMHPRRLLAEVDAKRRVLDLMMPGRPVYPGAYGQAYRDVLRLLALPYADRPGYRDEWKP